MDTGPHTDAEKRDLATRTLLQLSRGGEGVEELLPLVYDRLRAAAGGWFRRRDGGVTLQPTALVHEAYLHLVDQTAASWNDRAHFFAVAAKAMRQLLIQNARRRATQKRGGGWHRVDLDGQAAKAEDVTSLLAIDEAVEELSHLHERQGRVVEMRFFGGMTVEETAAALDVSTRTVELDWRAARAWLNSRLADPDTHGA